MMFWRSGGKGDLINHWTTKVIVEQPRLHRVCYLVSQYSLECFFEWHWSLKRFDGWKSKLMRKIVIKNFKFLLKKYVIVKKGFGLFPFLKNLTQVVVQLASSKLFSCRPASCSAATQGCSYAVQGCLGAVRGPLLAVQGYSAVVQGCLPAIRHFSAEV